MSAHRRAAQEGSAPGWNFEFTLDASIPGFAVNDRFRSTATADLCSTEFEKDSTHGKRKAHEKTTFEAEKGRASRETVGGGKSEIATGACGRDALTFFYYVRRELARGRLPAAEPVLFGAGYQVNLQYAGAQTVRIGDAHIEADRLTVTGKGPASTFSFEALFARDAARTPLLIKVPLAMGMFSMELVR
jgi:hypothetical protein